MPCDAQSLITAAYAKGFAALSERALKQCILYAVCAGPLTGYTAQQVYDLAIAAGYDKLSDREIEEATLAALCP